MTDRDTKLLKAAFNVFARYGVSKTTVSDIASEAGVSRQTMYNAYGGRDEILRATVAHLTEQNLAQVLDAWQQVETLSEKLEIFCNDGPLAWYDAIHNSPHAADLIEGLHTVAKAQMAIADKAWIIAISDAIDDHAVQEGAFKASDVADLFYVAAAQAKYNAESRQQLETRLSVLRTGILAMLGYK